MGTRTYGHYCAVARALDVVGDRWTLLVARELLNQGPCRFTDLRHGLPGVATNVLTARLREMEEAGLIERHDEPPPIAATLYRLTERGRELEPIVTALGRFGLGYMAEWSETDEFRSHWVSFVARTLMVDRDPGAGPIEIGVEVGGESIHLEVNGRVSLRSGASTDPALSITGAPPYVLGLLSGQLARHEAVELGVDLTGDLSVLDRIVPHVVTSVRS